MHQNPFPAGVQTPLVGSLQALPDTLAGLKGPTAKGRGGEGSVVESKKILKIDTDASPILAITLCLSLCLSQVDFLSKRLGGSSWFWHGGYKEKNCVCKEIQIYTKIGYFPLRLCAKLWT